MTSSPTSAAQTTPILEVALEAHHAGICVLPPREDGSKGPLSAPIPRNCADPGCKSVLASGKKTGWKHKQHVRSTVEEIERWYSEPGCTGLGFVCGEVSGGLECLEFEGPAVAEGLVEKFSDECRAQGLGAVLDRLTAGYFESTPGGGFHMLYFCPVVAGNAKLARRLKSPEEMKTAKNADDRIQVLIETRGEGGYIIVAPSNGRVHPTGGKWEIMSGSPTTIPALTVVERDALFRIAETFDKLAARPQDQPIGERPGQIYSQRTSWAEVLEPHGWILAYEQGGESYWRRPGKDATEGPSATTNYKGSDLFYNFSTSVDELETERGYNKFAVYTYLNHAGDFGVAARALVALGYGESSAASSVVRGSEDDPGDREELECEVEVPWPTPDLKVFRGLVGDAVGVLAPHTEADAVGLLGTLLTYLGCMVGRGPHFELSGGQHPARHFMVLAGDTSKARKGSAEAICKKLLRLVDPKFMQKNIGGGLSSGEGLIKLLADRVVDDATGKVTLAGVSDKRLYVCEDEFARILTAAQRDQSTLSMVLRQAWDGTTLRRATIEAFRATEPHVCIMAHCTFEELTDKMSSLEVANGFANRFVFLAVRRSQLLPLGSDLDALAMQPVALELQRVLEHARRLGRVTFSAEALERWTEEYARMAQDEDGGLLGAYTARGDTHVLRLALEYAWLDGASVIDWPHIEAAMALWAYSEQTVRVLLSRQRMSDASAEAGLGRLMEALQGVGRPISVMELRKMSGMNGVLFAATVAAGERKRLLTKDMEKRSKTGRPRVMIGLGLWR